MFPYIASFFRTSGAMHRARQMGPYEEHSDDHNKIVTHDFNLDILNTCSNNQDSKIG